MRDRESDPDAAPLDLSSLDPSRNGPRWNEMVNQVAQRAIAQRRARRRPTVAAQVVSWGRPVLAAAAILIAATWAIAGARAKSSATNATNAPATTTTTRTGALQVAQWASEDAAPDASSILAVLETEP